MAASKQKKMMHPQVELTAIQMQQQKLRNQQQLQQRGRMSYEPVPESQPNSQNYQNNPSENSNFVYRLELTTQQANYLTKCLPSFYSFQLESKPLKRSSSIQKNIRDQARIPPETKKKIAKEETRSNGGKAGSNRVQKSNSNRFTQEIENAVYQKYNPQKAYNRNTFDNVSEPLKPCVRILNLLKNSKTSWPFRQPVDPIALGIPIYREIIKEPMDLSTIENNLRTNQYVTPTQFHADVSKIITNSYTFNSSNIQFTRITAQFEAYYRKITSEPNSDNITKSYCMTDTGLDMYPSKLASLEAKKSKKDSKDMDYSTSSAPVISMAEKKELGLNIKKLPKEDMKGILDIVKEGTGKIIGQFDLKELDPLIIRKLQNYVKEKMNGEGKSKGIGMDNGNEGDQSQSSFELGEEDES